MRETVSEPSYRTLRIPGLRPSSSWFGRVVIRPMGAMRPTITPSMSDFGGAMPNRRVDGRSMKNSPKETIPRRRSFHISRWCIGPGQHRYD